MYDEFIIGNYHNTATTNPNLPSVSLYSNHGICITHPTLSPSPLISHFTRKALSLLHNV